jgi:hypothetical protein
MLHLRLKTAATSCAIALTLLVAASASAQPAGGRQVRYYNRTWTFNDVDVAKLVSRLSYVGLELPVELSGHISGSLNVGVPWNSLRDARAWRFGGTLTSPQLTISGFVLRGVSVRLQYRDGSLNLDELRLQLPPPQGAAGNVGLVLGTARMELVPRGQFTSTLTVTDVPMASMLGRIQELQPAAGSLSGNLTAQVAVDNLRDISAWTMSGPVTLRGLTLKNSPPALASVQFDLRGGQLAAHRAQLVVGPAAITTEAQLSLLGQRPWNATAQIGTGNLAATLELIARVVGNNEIAQAIQVVHNGTLRGTARVGGTLTPLTTNIAGHADLQNVVIQPPAEIAQQVPLKPLTVGQLSFDYNLANNALALSNIVATLAGGRVTGSTTVPLAQGDTHVQLAWNGLRLTDVLAPPFAGPGATAGRVNLSIPAGAFGDPAKWQLDANASVSELRYDQWTLNRLRTGDVTLKAGRLTVPAFTGQLDGQPLSLALDMQLAAPYSIAAQLNVPRVPVAWLRMLPQFADFQHRLGGFVGVSGKLNGTWNPLALQGGGQVVGRGLQLDRNTIDSVQFNYQLKPGELSISNLQAGVYRGRVTGGAMLAIGEKLGADATLQWNGINAAAAAAGLSFPTISAGGALNGSIKLTIPPGTLNERDKWTGAAQLQLDQLNLYAWQLRGIQIPDMQLAGGAFKAPTIAAQLDGQPLRASASLTLKEPWNVTADLDAKQLRVDRIAAIPQLASLRQRIGGLVDLNAHVEGTLSPLAVNARGTSAATGLVFDKHRIDQLTFGFDLTPKSLAVSNIKASLYDGQLAGNATVPLANDVAASAALNWSQIDAGRAVGEFVALPFPVQGRTDGNVNLTIPPGQLSNPLVWEADANVNLPDVSVRGLNVASINAKLSQHQQKLTYHAGGKLFGGTLELDGTRDANAPTAGLAALGTVKLRLEQAQLGTAADMATDRSKRPSPLRGTLSLDVAGGLTDQGWAWRGDATLGEVTVSGTRLTPGVHVRVVGVNDQIALEEVTGEFAGGQLSGSGRWRFTPRSTGLFRVGLRNARIEQLYALAEPNGKSPASGLIDVELHVHPGDIWRLVGTVSSPQLQAGGIRFSNVHVPIDADWSPATNRARLYVSSISTSLAGGRVAGRLTAEQYSGWNLNGNLQFSRIDLGVLSREVGSQSSYGRGTLTGTMKMTGRNMHSINDLQATLAADLQNTQATSIPVVSQLQSFVPGFAVSGSGGFQQGRLEAHLARGVVHVDRLSLASSQLQLYVSGLINLTGRLRLDAVVSIGQGNNPLMAQVLLTRLVASTVAPAALLLRANDFLSNRVIHAEIGGTIHRPVIRLQPFQTLREEVVRFFLREATGAVIPQSLAAPAVGAAAGTSSASHR